MTARFVTSPIDPRKLSMLPHHIARQHPSRREFVHGRVQPADSLVRMGRRIPSGTIAVALAIVIAAFFALQFARPLLGSKAASDGQRSHAASGSSASSVEAGGAHG